MEVEAVFSPDERLEIIDTNVEFADRGYWEVREVKTLSTTACDLKEEIISNGVDLSNDHNGKMEELNRLENNDYRKRTQSSELKINSVHYLLSKHVWSDAKRIVVKQLGRPTPNIHNGEVDESVCDKFDWVCGCPTTNRLFCFPCLLFRKSLLPWTNAGVAQQVMEQAKKHQSSLEHIYAYMDFNLAGKSNVLLKSVNLRDRISRNKGVERNRYVLHRLITSIKYSGESENLSDIVATHLEETKLFKEPLKTIRDELLDAIFAVYRAEMIEQIKSVDFVAIEVNEGTNSQDIRQAVLTFRYVVDGQICERFATFLKPATGSPEEFSELLLIELQDLDISKLIAQCYDGASLLIDTDTNNDISTVMRKTFPLAHCVHSYSHHFNLTAELAAQSCNTVKVFLAHLESFSQFFVGSAKAVSILCEIMKSTVSHPGPTLWDIKNRMAIILFEHKESFVDCLKDFADFNRVGTKTINEVYGLLGHLENPDFLYWLKIFHFITPHLEVFFKQARTGNIDHLQNGLEHFKRQIMLLRLSTAHMDKNEDEGPPKKRPRTHHGAAKEVCDTVLKQIETRFNFKSHLNASALLDSANFKSYQQSFPQKHFEAAVQSYPMLDGPKLRNELTAMYRQQDFSELDGIFPLLVFLTDNDMKTAMSETCKLVNILCTTPMLTCKSERCLSTVRKIKAFLSRAQSGDKLNALAVLSIEKVFIQHIPNFGDKVIDVFATAKNRKDFMYQ